jgi:FixJ family two-component response regulator
LLRACGLPAEAYASGRAFLDALPGRAPDCLILDIQMPGLTGFEVQAAMAAAGRAAATVFITADEDPAVRDRALAAGAAAFLRKPFTERELLDAIAAAVGRSAALAETA